MTTNATDTEPAPIVDVIMKDVPPFAGADAPADDLGSTAPKDTSSHGNTKKRPAPSAPSGCSPKKTSKTNEGEKMPVGDPVEDEDTPSEIAAKIAVAEAMSFYERGYADGRDGKYGRRAPSDDDENRERQFQYYKGYCEGAHNAVKGKGKAIHAPAAQNVDQEAWGADGGHEDVEEGRERHDEPAPALTNRERARRATMNGGFDGDEFDEYDVERKRENMSVHAILPPSNQPAARGARHLNPTPGPIVIHPLRHLDRPEGTDRRSITRNWHRQQREALYNYRRPGCFVKSELDSGSPACQEALAAVVKGIFGKVYQGQRPPFIIFPIPAYPGAPPPTGAFVSGTEEQIAHFVDICTWSTSWGCIYSFPNADLPSDFACTVRAPGFEYEQADIVLETILDELDKNETVQEFVESEGGDLDAIKDGAFLEFIRIKEGRFDVNLFNVYVPPPSRDEERALEWRRIIANLKPSNYLVGEFTSHPSPFKCATCGCLCHPQGMCPTISEPDWLGFLPTPHNQPASVKTEPQETKKSTVAVAGTSQAKDDATASSSSSKKPSAAHGKKADAASSKNGGQKNKSGPKNGKKK